MMYWWKRLDSSRATGTNACNLNMRFECHKFTVWGCGPPRRRMGVQIGLDEEHCSLGRKGGRDASDIGFAMFWMDHKCVELADHQYQV